MDATDTASSSPRSTAPGLLTKPILTAIAEVDDQPVDELPPLYEVIDPEALNALFAPRADGSSRTTGEVSFQYEGYTVTVSSEGAVEIDVTDQ